MNWQPRRRGFALLTVLWVLAFLALLGTGLLAAARQNAQRVANLGDAATVEAASEAALHQAIFALLDPSGRRWRVDGTLRRLRFNEASATLRFEDETGKVNPNIAPPELLEALLRQLGADRRAAARIAAAIVGGRDPARGGFGGLDELGALPGMTPELLIALWPHLSLFTTADPDATTTDPVVAAALGLPAPAAAPAGGAEDTRVVTVSIFVEGPRRTRFAERVSIRLNALTEVRRYEILARGPLPWPEDRDERR